MSGGSSVLIAVLLPDVLGTYSDAGHAAVLAQRLRWRGVPVEVRTVPADSVPPVGCDLYLLGGGEDAAQVFAADWLRRHRPLRAALGQGATTFAVCAGLQTLGLWFEDSAGHRHAGTEVLDLTTRPGRRRAIGEVVARCTLPGVGLLTGFENHRGVSTAAAGLAPLGRVQHGVGNGDGRGGDGVVTPSVLGTYLHGPVLARNPALADAVLARVLGRELPPLELTDQDAVRRLRLHARR
jgi:lipid II isoglutaminyl synthase (glutamine-hydrolysing)